ncbi:MAG: GtrA family protein [Luteimonas sp.]
MIARQFLLFLIAGGLAALANFGSRIGFNQFMSYVPAIVLAYCVGMFTAFILNRLFVFQQAGNALHHQALWFIVVNLAAVLQTVVVSLAMRDWVLPSLGIDVYPEAIAHALGVAVPVFTSYLGHKHLTFNGATR